jgi:hypothetical protein
VDTVHPVDKFNKQLVRLFITHGSLRMSIKQIAATLGISYSGARSWAERNNLTRVSEQCSGVVTYQLRPMQQFIANKLFIESGASASWLE